MLTPSGTWQWYWDQETDCLSVELDGGLCMVTAITSKTANHVINSALAFSLENTQVYYSAMEALDSFCPHLSKAQAVQISLNACAIKQFHKPVGLKSWYFDEQSKVNQLPCAIASLKAVNKADVLVLEEDVISSTCMLIGEKIVLAENKTVGQFSVLKVASNRLIFAEPCIEQQKYA